MLPFDREHTTSCLTLIETARLYRTVFEIWPVICQKSPIKKHLQIVPVFGAPVRGGPPSTFANIFGNRILESLGCRVALFA